jgi:NitT/TauT family transport system permease protein
VVKQLKGEKTSYSEEHLLYLRNNRKKTIAVHAIRTGIFVLLLALWELAARLGWIDAFIVSSPSRVWCTLVSLNRAGQLWNNVYFTVAETVSGFVLGTALGIIIAVIIWWSDFVFKVIEPYLVVLNALPKVALGPVIIVWMGAGMGSIIVMALMVSVIISTINILTGFKGVSSEKVLLMRSFGATRMQILLKLIIPANIPTIISALKINVGMSLIGVITGEFLVSEHGIGYLIVYGGQVFKLDLVMAGIFLLGVIASVMYMVVAKVERFYLKRSK